MEILCLVLELGVNGHGLGHDQFFPQTLPAQII